MPGLFRKGRPRFSMLSVLQNMMFKKKQNCAIIVGSNERNHVIKV